MKILVTGGASFISSHLVDITLVKDFLNWEPKIDFEQGIKKTKEWFTHIFISSLKR